MYIIPNHHCIIATAADNSPRATVDIPSQVAHITAQLTSLLNTAVSHYQLQVSQILLPVSTEKSVPTVYQPAVPPVFQPATIVKSYASAASSARPPSCSHTTVKRSSSLTTRVPVKISKKSVHERGRIAFVSDSTLAGILRCHSL